MKPTPEQIAKLPKWAQEHIENLQRQGAAATKALNRYLDNQTPSPIYIADHVSDQPSGGPRFTRNYIQHAHNIAIDWCGVSLGICLRNRTGDKGIGSIDLTWGNTDGTPREDLGVAFQPFSFCQARLVTKNQLSH